MLLKSAVMVVLFVPLVTSSILTSPDILDKDLALSAQQSVLDISGRKIQILAYVHALRSNIAHVVPNLGEIYLFW